MTEEASPRPRLTQHYVYFDNESSTLRTSEFSDGILRCKGCNYILSGEHVSACRYCLGDLNTKNKKLRSSLNEMKAEIFHLQKEMEFLRTWDERFVNGTASTGDITLKTRDGYCFNTYRFLLASRSPVFKRILEKRPLNELEVEDVSAHELGFLVDYLYRAQVDHRTLERFAPGLLAAAQRYQIFPLKAVCEQYLTDHVHTNNVVSMIELAFKSDADNLKDAAFHVAASIYKDLMSCPDMKNLLEREPRIAAEMLKEILVRTNP
ncbi:hypothetical protein L7F22_020511 [Adiantum nelumboides]|nr:hypothetical protein [Adiantum nelumboides]